MKRESQLTGLMLLLATLFGVYVRVFVPARAGFPVLDGGLFYTMIGDLLANDFRLPSVTSYNSLDIPFAYPPLSFYLTGAIHLLTGADVLDILRWLPVFFSLLTIPAFFLLARELLESSAQAALATLVFALLPRSYDWIVMGGGVTRAPAAVFLILFLWACYRAFARRSWKMAFWAAFWGGLVSLSHPERALHAAASGLLFWLWLERSRSGTLRALTIGGGTLLVSAPWWMTVLSRYGAQMLLLAAQAGGPRELFWTPLLQLNFTDETVPLAALLAVFGAFISWKERKAWLAIWFVLAFLTDPRSAPHVIAVQVALLATISLTDALIPALTRSSDDWQDVLAKAPGKIFFGYILMVMLFNAQWNLSQLGRYVLTEANRQAMAWVSVETPPASRFLVLDWQNMPTLSPLLEWFPALSKRVNVVTVQGREWLPGAAHFSSRMETYPDLYACLYQEVTCLETWAQANAETFDFVYLSFETINGDLRLSRLSDSLIASPKYDLVYDTPQVLIFQRLP